MVSHLDDIQGPNRTVSFCWSISTGVSIFRNSEENITYEFILIAQVASKHALLVLIGWFVRWEVSGRSTAVLRDRGKNRGKWKSIIGATKVYAPDILLGRL